MSKDLSKLTPEQLIELAKNPVKTVKKDSNFSPVRDFIIFNKLEDGNYPIPGLIIYEKFSKWCKANGIRPLTESTFFVEFRTFYPNKKRTTDGIAYILSPKGFDLSAGHIAKLKKQYNDKKRTSYDKKKKKGKENQES